MDGMRETRDLRGVRGGERERGNLCVCVCVCVRERERERERERNEGPLGLGFFIFKFNKWVDWVGRLPNKIRVIHYPPEIQKFLKNLYLTE